MRRRVRHSPARITCRTMQPLCSSVPPSMQPLPTVAAYTCYIVSWYLKGTRTRLPLRHLCRPKLHTITATTEIRHMGKDTAIPLWACRRPLPCSARLLPHQISHVFHLHKCHHQRQMTHCERCRKQCYLALSRLCHGCCGYHPALPSSHALLMSSAIHRFRHNASRTLNRVLSKEQRNSSALSPTSLLHATPGTPLGPTPDTAVHNRKRNEGLQRSARMNRAMHLPTSHCCR